MIDKLAAALQTARKNPSLAKKFEELGTEPAPANRATPQALHTYLKAELDKWGPIVKKAGIYAD